MSSGNDAPVELTPPSEEGDTSSKGEGNVPASEPAPSSGSGSSFMDRFGNVREYASTAEERANQLNAQFGSLCNRLKGDQKTGEETEKKVEGEESLVDQITDFGSKGYGLMGSLGKKFEKK